MKMFCYHHCNRETKLLKLKANYNCVDRTKRPTRNCNYEIKLLKLKANYNLNRPKLKGLSL